MIKRKHRLITNLSTRVATRCGSNLPVDCSRLFSTNSNGRSIRPTPVATTTVTTANNNKSPPTDVPNIPTSFTQHQDHSKKLIELRHYLHAHPEVSRKEIQTSKYLQHYLYQNDDDDDTVDVAPDELIPLAGNGFAVVYKGRRRPSKEDNTVEKTVLIRAELDALPIQERNSDLSYSSRYDGVSHKCGHDGHMAIAVGVAKWYARRREDLLRVGTNVIVLFQPDEETGTGAYECIQHDNFQKYLPAPTTAASSSHNTTTIDYVFALHNFPGFPRHQIICKPHAFMSAVKFVAIQLHGKETHSAMPEKGSSPAWAIAEITQMVKDIQSQFDTRTTANEGIMSSSEEEEEDYALIVPIYYNMGVSSSGVAPGYGEAHYTLRTSRNDVLENMWDIFSTNVQAIADRHGLRVEWTIKEQFTASWNNPDSVEMIQKAAHENRFDYCHLPAPFRAGEDFGEFTRRYKGTMFGIGAGENRPDLHDPEYDFPDEIIPTGISMFKSLIDQALEIGAYEELSNTSRSK